MAVLYVLIVAAMFVAGFMLGHEAGKAQVSN